jgi:hypothetical protein
MGLFTSILSKLGIDEKKAPAAPKEAPPVPRSTQDDAAVRAERMKRIKAMREEKEDLVDVTKMLDDLEKEKGVDTNWRTSIADLLFLIDVDNSYEARKELAVELGCPAEKMEPSESMNMWLHSTVLEMIAENGGNIPMELLD